MSPISTVAVIGTGAIGTSWVQLALEHGFVVHASDPAPREMPDGTVFFDDPGEAVAEADLVIECGPERVDLKRELFAQLDAAARPDVVLASSSSGIGPSQFQDACAHPERVLVAHPFNPPHLIPLVEVVGGRLTSEAAIETTMSAMRDLGRRPVRVNMELPGHVVNRLQAALWREAYDLVGRGAISVADLDAAVAYGPGLRWALLGPIATQALSGGEGGLAHVLEHLGPPTYGWWETLRTPEVTPELERALVEGVEAELAGQDDVRERRDAALAALAALKQEYGL
ncbi:3-hydroxyacyl-CoA dehydrogenase [Nocardioides mangrovicus]|uniref:3-hydroxyacyl-CoA dehydrogenase n=1 Tax=Nocardioides mangrovicus TaxID=2478913 RepID=A0A3L8NZZ3_9ACTN|nr:3-hydroxyacyl-CoA dehydrogenase NAD-binding domain-containing protein [Nocardioides mangrovicus]RLV48232.1 3-hydroxyacyl-CoA dehydrogenase [Nocardioides mangrovicus]